MEQNQSKQITQNKTRIKEEKRGLKKNCYQEWEKQNLRDKIQVLMYPYLHSQLESGFAVVGKAIRSGYKAKNSCGPVEPPVSVPPAVTKAPWISLWIIQPLLLEEEAPRPSLPTPSKYWVEKLNSEKGGTYPCPSGDWLRWVTLEIPYLSVGLWVAQHPEPVT